MNRFSIKHTALLSLVFALGCGPELIPEFDDPRTSVLVIDMQVDFLSAEGRLPADQDQVPPMLEATAALLDDADDHGDDISYVVNEFDPLDIVANLFRNNAAIKGQPGVEMDPRIEVKSDFVFVKSAPSAFTNPDLFDHFVEEEVGELVVLGVFADQCVKATSMEAHDRGFVVTVLSDGVAAKDDATRDSALDEYRRAGIAVKSSAEFISARD